MQELEEAAHKAKAMGVQPLARRARRSVSYKEWVFLKEIKLFFLIFIFLLLRKSYTSNNSMYFYSVLIILTKKTNLKFPTCLFVQYRDGIPHTQVDRLHGGSDQEPGSSQPRPRNLHLICNGLHQSCVQKI